MAANIQNPLVLQDKWLLDAVVRSITRRQYVGGMIKKNFIKHNKTINRKTAILRVFQFLKTTKDGGITAIVCDETHKILCKFNRNAVRQFEKQYNQRITYGTTNSTFIINTGHLQFVKKFQLVNDYNFQKDVFVLEIDRCSIFQRDQVIYHLKINQSIYFVYDDKAVQEKLEKPPEKIKPKPEASEIASLATNTQTNENIY